MSVVVRDAAPGDADTLYELVLALARFHAQEHLVDTTREELSRAAFGDRPEFAALIAEIESEVVGYLSFTWSYSVWRGSGVMLIDDVYVHERFRGCGAGEALMRAAAERCQRAGVPRLRWEVERDNDKAIAFYRKLGATVDIKGVCRWVPEDGADATA